MPEGDSGPTRDPNICAASDGRKLSLAHYLRIG
jgi:hypothetical protein